MFKSIKIKNLRAITELEVDNLAPINLFVGQNGCGKTTFLEAVFFLIGATNPKLPINANVFRDLPFLSKRSWITFFHNMDLSVPIEIMGQTYETKEQQFLLIRPRKEKLHETKSPQADGSSLSFAPGDSETMFEPDGLELEYTSSNEPGSKSTSAVFLKDGGLIVEGVKERKIRGIFVNPYTISDWKGRFAEVQRKKRLVQLIALLKEIEPNLADFRLNEIGILEADINLPKLIPANLMGGGIAKFLSIALAMLDYQNGIVLIDELENGLSHSSQQKVWEAILNWARNLNVQVFATTHSFECIKAFSNSIDSALFETEAKLFRIERKDEKFRAVHYTKDILAESLESKWEIR